MKEKYSPNKIFKDINNLISSNQQQILKASFANIATLAKSNEIISYAMTLNPKLTSEITEINVPVEFNARIPSTDQIIGKFYAEEAKHKFFGFENVGAFKRAKLVAPKYKNIVKELATEKQNLARYEYEALIEDINTETIDKKIKDENQAEIKKLNFFLDLAKKLDTIGFINTTINKLNQAISNAEQGSKKVKSLQSQIDQLSAFQREYAEIDKPKEKIIDELKSQIEQCNKDLAGLNISREKSAEEKAAEIIAVQTQKALVEQLQKTVAYKIAVHKAAKDAYVKAFHFSKIIGDYVEGNNTFSNDLAYKHAYDMSICFSGLAAAGAQKYVDVIEQYQKFASNHGMDKLVKMLHDSFSAFSIPAQGLHVSLDQWQDMIFTSGTAAMKLFAIADKIEVKNAELKASPLAHIAPADIEEATSLKTQVSYKNAQKNPELAKIFSEHNIAEEKFEQAINEIEPRKKLQIIYLISQLMVKI